MKQITQLSEFFTIENVITEKNKLPKAFFLKTTSEDTNNINTTQINIEVVSENQSHFHSKSDKEIYDAIETQLKNLTAGKICYTGTLAEKTASESIGVNSLRSNGNVRYKDYIMYQGELIADQLAYIVKDQHDEYWLFFHPQASNYIEKVATNS